MTYVTEGKNDKGEWITWRTWSASTIQAARRLHRDYINTWHADWHENFRLVRIINTVSEISV